jgi:hypothetical protein
MVTGTQSVTHPCTCQPAQVTKPMQIPSCPVVVIVIGTTKGLLVKLKIEMRKKEKTYPKAQETSSTSLGPFSSFPSSCHCPPSLFPPHHHVLIVVLSLLLSLLFVACCHSLSLPFYTPCKQRLIAVIWGLQNVYNIRYNRLVKRNAKK